MSRTGAPRPWLAGWLALGLAGCTAPGGLEHLPAPGALGPYSGAVLAGEWCFLSGRIGSPGAPFEQEVEAALDAVEEQLQRTGLDLSDVVFVTVYMTDMDRYAQFNQIYGRRFEPPCPARACVGVAALPGGARVEIVALARRRNG